MITAANYRINGLNQPISQPTKTIMSQPIPTGEVGSGTYTVMFPMRGDLCFDIDRLIFIYKMLSCRKAIMMMFFFNSSFRPACDITRPS
jgi:hypothetical protein